MNIEKIKAGKILDIATKIYQLQEQYNPGVVFGNETFLIGTEKNPEKIIVRRDYEEKDSHYYFETSEIKGVVIKRENGSYCIKARVKYKNKDNQDLYFAKIRIENSYDGEIQIMGTWGGDWNKPDFEDENQLENPNSDFPIALEAMEYYLSNIWNQLNEQYELNKNLHIPKWVKQLKKI